ncbi:MAG: FMN-binding glutamate synthase family protein [Gammaproteobacteria bacterium]|nr:FMN-binding glutamate synthase family protein [Gammaproteobacteria bacterium]MCW8988044.1 FMN-binding glutamate synthase family protein [Gammaproteobacteria bacterium]MCW9031118.1 FMN-binding glutamate synthase family protein [Gammaproteobacteria bacterium]
MFENVISNLSWSVVALYLFYAVIIGLIWLFIHDVMQKHHSIQRNYPVIGHFRYMFENMGEYFRQYWFAGDREELPFNRATRAWIYRTAKGLGGLLGFGSTNDLRQTGSIIFVNAAYPMLEEEFTDVPSVIIGPDCEHPFEAKSIFNISGMSYGAISAAAVRALSKGAAGAGIWMNTGEGGISPFHIEGGCDVIYQIGTAKYGVRDEQANLSDEKLRLVSKHVRAFEIKLSQGAKPGRGGVLPAAKVTAEIAEIRGIPAGQVSSSPNRHKEIRSADDLLDMINRVRDVTGKPVGFKSVFGSEKFPNELCDAILKRGIEYAPDFITVDGGEGGTGAAPQILADHVGLPITESLPLVVDVLADYGLRDRIKIIASGKLVHSAKVAWALCVGADFVVSARGFMFSLGCVQSMQCHKDTCPTGITTHSKYRQRGLVVTEKSERVKGYAHWMNYEVNALAHSCGLGNAREFKREHIRIVQSPGVSLPLDIVHPYRAQTKSA